MQDIIDIINKLKTLSGNDQIKELSKHKDNELLKEILTYTYNKDKYKISNKKLEKSLLSQKYIKSNTQYTWQDFKAILDRLKILKATTEKDVEEVLRAINSNPEHIANLFKQVLLKDLRIGLNRATINKVFGGDTIEKEYVMLAKDYDEKYKCKNPRYSRKMDGCRMWLSDGVAYSRKNNIFPTCNIQHILDELKEISREYVLDGELVYIDNNGIESFKKTTNYVKKEQLLDGHENIRYVIFYCVKKEDWFNRSNSCTLDLNIMNSGNKNIDLGYSKNNSHSIFSLNQFEEKDLEVLKENKIKYNWEGIMRLDIDSTYQYKRSNVLQKIKEFQDDEFNIVDFKIGSKKFSNTLGSITIQLDCGSLVDVGSGFDDDERDLLWTNKGVILNDKDIKLKVQYFEKTSNQKGGNSLRFPSFKGFRKNMEEWII